MILTLVDTTQIQSYIFGSNRLRENIGASHMVALATGQWALEAVNQSAPKNNIVNVGNAELNQRQRIEAESGPDAEVVYAGGGNAVVIFRTPDQAATFSTTLSRRVMEEAPGLQLVIESVELDWANDSLVTGMESAFKKLGKAKGSPRYSAPLLGLAVTVGCQSTSLPAVEMVQVAEEEPRPASAETVAKLKANGAAKSRLERVVGSLDQYQYEYPDELDHLGRDIGEQSHLAVVHADGDGMGKKIESLGDKYRKPVTGNDHSVVNRSYVDALRAFSRAVAEAAQVALRTTLSSMLAAIDLDDENPGNHIIPHRAARQAKVDWIAPVTLAAEKNKAGQIKYRYVPFRPLVFGGDDVTFVCDGRIGISLAKIYVEAFAEETAKRPECGGTITSCAGVSIVKTHYPFARAYQIAEELTKSAKSYRNEIADKRNDWKDACLDWHFALAGLSGRLVDIREREYTVREGSLLLRPLTLGENPKEKHRSWQVVERLLSEFQTAGQWAGKRNKVKSLREMLRDGESAVREFLNLYELNELPETGQRLSADHRKKGWEGQRCLYFDAIEMADWHIPLKTNSTEGEHAHAE